jgi:hypothetical protein
MRRLLIAITAITMLCGIVAQAQESQSLGDVARQVRLQKQQKEAQSKPNTGAQSGAVSQTSDSKDARAITNENMYQQTASIAASKPKHDRDEDKQVDPSDPAKQSDHAEEIKAAIQSQKSAIASAKQEMESLSNSIHYAGGSCIANCAQWNERQKEKQDEVERMKTQIEEQQTRLEEMQESARKQGFGSSVYEPD